jgi:hypothetical protein
MKSDVIHNYNGPNNVVVLFRLDNQEISIETQGNHGNRLRQSMMGMNPEEVRGLQEVLPVAVLIADGTIAIAW